jgi:hypothetical protein
MSPDNAESCTVCRNNDDFTCPKATTKGTVIPKNPNVVHHGTYCTPLQAMNMEADTAPSRHSCENQQNVHDTEQKENNYFASVWKGDEV